MTRRAIEIGIAALHVLVLLAAVSVPAYAIGDALSALFGGRATDSFGPVVSLHRWSVLLGNTLIVCGTAALTALVPGLIYGLLIARTDLPGRSVLLLLAVLGACIPIYATMVFAGAYIPVSRFHGSAVACGVLYGLLYAPLATLVFAAAFHAVDRTHEEQALLDASLPRVLWHVTLPQARWAVATLLILVLLLVATDYTITDVLMVRTFAEEVLTQFQLHRACGGPLLTAMPILAAMALLLALVQRRYRLLGEQSPWQSGTRSLTVPLGAARGPVALAAFAVPAVLVGVPARALLTRIGSFHTFVTEASSLSDEITRSMKASFGGGTLVILFAVGLAWYAIRARRGRWLVGAATVLLMAVPAPVVGISLIGMLDRPGWHWLGLDWPGAIYDSPVILVIAYLVRFLPVAVLLLLPSVQRVPVELEWAARIDGCNWPALQWHVYWPAMRRPIAVAWLVVVILCFAEIGATVLLVPGPWETASVRAFTLIHYGVYPGLAVLAVLSIGCIVVPWALLMCVARRSASEG